MEPVLDVDTADAFREEVLAASEPTVVLFWATWCPFCLRFKPIFDEAARGSDLRFAAVYLDDVDNPLWDTYDVEVVPTLALFAQGALRFRRDGRLMHGLSEGDMGAFLAAAQGLRAAP
jgi:thioredoxin 1